jgi:4-hydroxy-tetrahydrodipicolinate reductase
MKLVLIGYGQMGKAVAAAAIARNHEIVLTVASANSAEINRLAEYDADVALEFSRPDTVFDNVCKCLEARIPVVCGTTGWGDRIMTAKDLATHYNTGFLYASNFSLGVNIFFEINKKLAALMQHLPQYTVSIKEIHHTRKKDAPSGTAITLAEQIISEGNARHLSGWQLVAEGEAPTNERLPIVAHRAGDVPGTHSIRYDDATDSIEIIHTAKNRNGFALGAVLAAEFICGKKGVFTMQDVLAGTIV